MNQRYQGYQEFFYFFRKRKEKRGRNKTSTTIPFRIINLSDIIPLQTFFDPFKNPEISSSSQKHCYIHFQAWLVFPPLSPLTYEIPLHASRAEHHYPPVLLDKFAEPLRSLGACQRFARHVKIVLHLVLEILRLAFLSWGALPRGHGAQGHHSCDQTFASHAPRGRPVFLHVHQIPYATPHIQIPRLKIRSRQGGRVWKRLGAFLCRSDHIRFILKLVQLRQRGPTTYPRLQ